MTEDITTDLAVEGQQAHGQPPLPRKGALGRWWWQGVRSAALLRVDWTGLQVAPGIMAWLVIVSTLLSIGIARLYIVGQADFYSPALLSGWLGTVVAAWVSWFLVPDQQHHALPGPPSAAHLLAMLLSQTLALFLLSGLLGLVVARGMDIDPPLLRREIYRVLSWVLLYWAVLSQVTLLWRLVAPTVPRRAFASMLLAVSHVAYATLDTPSYWYPASEQATQVPVQEPFRLTQELIELQPVLLREKFAAIKAAPAGKTSLYAITFAPYASEDVFQRESEMVAGVMQERFGTTDRTIQLVNHAATASAWPWATPLNLKRAINRMAEVMDRQQDVLFIHLTSHGARDGQLSAEFGPLMVEPVTPALLNAMLDEAGIRYRVISVSACYSGSWIEPLANPGTLVMTAADAHHTSYGCGRGSELTYFGRAMFAEALQTTWSFEQAHAAARLVIDQRERGAGKTDGYSNPQIRMGASIRPKLAQLVAERRSP